MSDFAYGYCIYLAAFIPLALIDWLLVNPRSHLWFSVIMGLSVFACLTLKGKAVQRRRVRQ